MPTHTRPAAGIRGRLLHRIQLNQQRLAYYYRVLSEDGKFRQELQELYAQLRPSLDDPQTILTELFPKLNRDAVASFVRRWRLPPADGRHDVLHSLRIIHDDGAAVAARQPGAKVGWLLEPAPRGFDAAAKPDDLTITIAQRRFRFDPSRLSPADLHVGADAVAAAVKEEVIRGGEALIQLSKADRSFETPRDLDRAHMLRMARRLYRAAILGWNWARIADEEAMEGVGTPDEKSVANTVRDWAQATGVPLPTRRPGRPRKTA